MSLGSLVRALCVCVRVCEGGERERREECESDEERKRSTKERRGDTGISTHESM